MTLRKEISYQAAPGKIHRAKVIVKNQREKIQNRWLHGLFYETQRHGMLNYVYKKFQGGVFVDVGAAIGNHSLFFACCCHAEQVYAFEPVPALFAHLLDNVALNKIDRIQAWNVALGETTTEVGIRPSNAPPERGGMLMSRVDESGTGTRLARLDDILQAEGAARVDCLKIDVEGYNLPVLRGARETLARFRPAVFCECETPSQFKAVDDFLADLGYRVWTINDKPFVMNHTPTYRWEYVGEEMDVALIITTYNRPDSLRELLHELIADAGELTVRCRVYNDGSTIAYKQMPPGVTGFQIEYIDVQPNHGKQNYWRLINRLFNDLRAIRSRYYIQLPDDARIRPGFFQEMIRVYQAIDDPQKICLNLYLDSSRIGRACWTKTVPAIRRFNQTSVFSVGWIDMIYLVERRFFAELDFAIQPIPAARWTRNPLLSSGVGAQISRRLTRFSMYQVRDCWLINAEGDSLMNPDRPDSEDLSVAHLDPIICGVASIPERVELLRNAVASTLPFVDELHVYLNNYPATPRFLEQPKIYVHRSQANGDLGDAGKFYAAGQKRGFFLAIDDDIIYPEGYVWRMVNEVRANRAAGRKVVVGLHGKVMGEEVCHFYQGHRKLYHCRAALTQNQPVHLLGTGTVAFHTGDLPIGIEDFHGPRNMADIHFAIACQKHDVGCIALSRAKNYVTLQKNPTGKSIWRRHRHDDRLQTELYNSWSDWRLRV
jgi:FkbM family methyltransferase